MAIEQRGDEELAPDVVRRALEKVLASETFRSSPQLAVFLRFVVEAALRGESSRIKGYTIGVEALGRPETFDPLIDPIVRVEATRLRRTLERYYGGPGASDPIVFGLARGSYVPTIRRQPGAAAMSRESAVAALWRKLPANRVRYAAFALAAVAVMTAAAIVLNMLGRSGPEGARRGPGGADFNEPLGPGNGMPTLVIQQVRVLGVPRGQITFARPLVEKMGAAFVRFDTVNIAVEPVDASAAAPPQRDAGGDYQLAGSGEYREGGGGTLRFSLLEPAGTVVWSRSFEISAGQDRGRVEDTVVRQLATSLLAPFGVIRAHERRKHLAFGAGDPRYRCIVETSEALRTFDPAQQARARDCLEMLTTKDPSFAMGFAYLAAVYTREFQYGHSAAGDDPLLDKAVRAARQAVELKPESARAYQMLSTVLFARRDIEGAFAAGERAIALNPHDMIVLSDHGGRLIANGEVDRGMEMLLRAGEDGALRASWYHFYLFLGSYLKNDLAAASHHAGLITPENNPLGLLARALCAAAGGNAELARKTYDRLATLRPGWRERPRDPLERVFSSPVVVDRLEGDLVRAGLTRAR